MIMRFELPRTVVTILERLTDAGFDSYIVGGCVRDMMMGIVPHDWDICTSATPIEVKQIFKHVIPTGEKHGTVTVMLDGGAYEVTTFRTDGNYTDGRHPDTVSFTRLITEDLARRDFTINAMAYNPSFGLLDIFGGQADIESRIIRAVGNPNERFSEDALRMMRAVRFSAQFDFEIDDTVIFSIIANADKIKNVSFERIRDEIVKTITSSNPDHFRLFHFTGLLKHIAPELDFIFGYAQDNPHHVYDVGVHTLMSMLMIKNDLILRLAMLFHDIGKPYTRTFEDGIAHFYGHDRMSAEIAERIMERLHFDNATIDAVVKLVRFHMAEIAPTRPSVKRWMNRLGTHEEFMNLLAVRGADAGAQNPSDFDESFALLNACASLADEIKKDGDAFTKKDLKVNGHDLISIGVPQDKRMSEIFNTLVEMVIDNPALNDKDKLIEIVKSMKW